MPGGIERAAERAPRDDRDRRRGGPGSGGRARGSVGRDHAAHRGVRDAQESGAAPRVYSRLCARVGGLAFGGGHRRAAGPLVTALMPGGWNAAIAALLSPGPDQISWAVWLGGGLVTLLA